MRSSWRCAGCGHWQGDIRIDVLALATRESLREGRMQQGTDGVGFGFPRALAQIAGRQQATMRDPVGNVRSIPARRAFRRETLWQRRVEKHFARDIVDAFQHAIERLGIGQGRAACGIDLKMQATCKQVFGRAAPEARQRGQRQDIGQGLGCSGRPCQKRRGDMTTFTAHAGKGLRIRIQRGIGIGEIARIEGLQGVLHPPRPRARIDHLGTDSGSLYYSPYYDIPGFCYGLCIDSGYICAEEAAAFVKA